MRFKQAVPPDDMEEIQEEKVDDRFGAQGEEGSDWPSHRACHTHERAIPIQETVEALDITEEGKHRSIKAQTLKVEVE